MKIDKSKQRVSQREKMNKTVLSLICIGIIILTTTGISVNYLQDMTFLENEESFEIKKSSITLWITLSMVSIGKELWLDNVQNSLKWYKKGQIKTNDK